MTPETRAAAHAFGKEVCRGNRDAEVFCHLMFNYLHFCDDMVDCREDGRPTMKAEEIIQGFLLQAQLFNCPFWRQNSDILFSAIVVVTNQWADSVLWERSPIKHRRTMANTLRMVGDDMFCLVAMLCGGVAHMRAMSPKIRETDWLKQNAGDPSDQF